MFEIIKLPSLELIDLLEDKKIPINYKIKKKVNYGFYYKKFLYGIYRFKFSTAYFHYFDHLAYQPIKIISSNILSNKDNYKKIIHTFQIENQTLQELYLKLSFKKKIIISYLYKKNPQLFSHFQVEDAREINSFITRINKLINSENQDIFSIIKNLGANLFEQLFSKKIKSIFPHINRFIILVDHSINLLPLNNKLTFFLIKHPTCFHHKIEKKKVNKKIKSFKVISSIEDPFMRDEVTNIGNIFKKKRQLSFTILKEPSSSQFLDNLANTDFLHILYHGSKKKESFFLLEKDKPFIQDYQLFKFSPPPILLFSSCFSKSPSVIDWFFKNGGQTLIVCQGPLFSVNLSQAWKMFYWHLFFKKVTIKIAYAKMITKLLYLKDPNIFKFHLYGYGQETI